MESMGLILVLVEVLIHSSLFLMESPYLIDVHMLMLDLIDHIHSVMIAKLLYF